MNTTYAQRVQSTPISNIFYPKKEQSIILNALPNIPINKYILAVANIIDPSKITYAGKMSNNRICVCLKTKADADFITDHHKSITINNQNIIIRKFSSPSHRLVIWTFPGIPNEYIINLLKLKGVNPVSDMFFMSAGVNDPRLAHVKSFHRYIFINEDHPIIPDMINLTYENEQYKTYFTVEEKQCQNCGKFGHETEKCNKTEIPATLTPQTYTSPRENIIIEDSQENANQNESISTSQMLTETQITNTPLPTTRVEDSQEASTQIQNLKTNDQTTPTTPINEEITHKTSDDDKKNEFKLPNDKSKKRLHSNETNSEEDNAHKYQVIGNESEESDDSSLNSEDLIPKAPTEQEKIISDQIKDLKEPMENEPEKYAFNYETLKKLLMESKGNPHISGILKKYNLVAEHSINTLETLKPILKDPKAKSAITRVITKIKKTQNL